MKEIHKFKIKLKTLRAKSLFYKSLSFIIELLGVAGAVILVVSIIGMFLFGVAVIITIFELPKWVVIIGALVVGLVMTIYRRVRNATR